MSVTHRAYSLLEIKDLNEEQRIITGIASTPTPDRMADVVMPAGAQFKLPIPLLWQHDSDCPIGQVTDAKVTKSGIEVVASIAKGVSEDIDKAWNLIKAGLVRGLSIGFRGLEQDSIPNSWGIIFNKWEWLELSCVTIPANAEATITSVKKFDTKASSPMWEMAASKTLPIDESDAWDGAAAAKRVLDWAGIGDETPEPAGDIAKARRAFLAYDAANASNVTAYKLPFADVIGGELKAVAGGLRAAASRLPQTDIPESVQKSARAVLDAYFAKLNGDQQLSGDASTAATGKPVRVVRLDDPARDRAKPHVIRSIKR